MGTTSPKVNVFRKSSLSPSFEVDGKMAADFLKSHVNEARQLGERMGTTSPKVNVESFKHFRESKEQKSSQRE